MALNQRYTRADHISFPAPRALKSGDPVRIGQFAGVVHTDAARDEMVTLWLDGSYILTVNGTVTVGQQINLTSTGMLSSTVGNGEPFGVALTPAGPGNSPVEVAPYGKVPR
ncbi:DUF2190 family protein [Rothia sp. AR01]|uniref:DUF2190 family protein n=1 Tax=Rothia santali TaxID=2949643 RepID=A0A9X2HB05_9MICC|nr:DUF2190 family protein [Rothia santali]MCP3426021.1 DUF2190 family protein [Rothia santali]